MSHPHLTAAAAAGLALSVPSPAGPSRHGSNMASRAPSHFSRSTSTFGAGPSTLSVPSSGGMVSTPHLTATHTPAPEKEGLRSMLRGMVHAPKYAVFDVSVTIEALEQVPQTEGVFEARWKFNGKSPAGKEAAKLSHKASMPEIRSPLHMHPPHSAAQSTISLRSSNTSLSSTSSPTASIHPPTTGVRSLATPQGSIHSPLSMTVVGRAPNHSPPRALGKKGSDPTPLRQSLKAGDAGEDARASGDEEGDVVESPQDIFNPIDLASPANSLKELSHTDNDHAPHAPGQGADGGALRIHTGQPAIPTRSTSHLMNLPDTSTRSFSSNMARSTRPATVPAPIRSGTGPSPAVLLGAPPAVAGDRPGIMVRSPRGMSASSGSTNGDQKPRQSLDGPMSAVSKASTQSAASQASAGKNGILGLGRSQTRTSQTDDKSTHNKDESHHRKGVTEPRRLRQHACQWSHTVRHTVKIPMGRPVAATPMHSGTATPNAGAKKEMAPILGNGQHSESGFRLIINEIRTMHASPIDNGATMQQGLKQDMKEEVKHIAEGVQKAVAHPVRAASQSIKEHRLLFGTVEFDLAQFAGKGKVNRRFLLRGSRTNAVVAVKVELQQVGGEIHWAAPPLQEGHHVTTGDFTASNVSARAPELTLNRNSSNSSSGSAEGESGGNTSASNLNIARMRPRSHSDVSLNNAPTKVGYRGYEHHLKPTDGPSERSRSRRGRLPRTPPDSPRAAGQPSVAHLDSPGLDDAQDMLAPLSPSTSSNRRSSVLPFDRTRRIHRHHSLHLRNFAAHHLSGSGSADPLDHRHSHHRRHGHDGGGIVHGVLDLAPELVIEGIFNPKQGLEEGPMTIGPDRFLPTPLDVPEINVDLDDGAEQVDEGILTIGGAPAGDAEARPANRRRGWTGLRRGKKDKDKEGQWVIASLTGAASSVPGAAAGQAQGQGPGPGEGQEGRLGLHLPPPGYMGDGDAEGRNRRGGLDLDSRTHSASTIRAYHLGQGIAASQPRTPVGTA